MSLRALALALAALALCATPAAAQKLKVVATFSILEDMVEHVAGDRAELTMLVGPDADAHVFEPTATDARAVAAARIVFANGLGYDAWIARLLKSTGSRARLVILSEHVEALPFRRAGDDGHRKPGAPDPHAWQDVRNAIAYVESVERALAAADTANAAIYKANAAAYLTELRALHTDIRAAFAEIPNARRRVINAHDAFGYFAAAYGVEFIAPLGTSTEEQASAKGVARLITQIRREKITAVFVENISDPRLIEQIARETGVKIGGKLYSDALSTRAGPAPTYVAMMRHNVKLLTAAMAPAL